MYTKLYWIDGPWRGKLAIAARPRGGDWIADEIASWRGSGVDVIVSLLTAEEERDLNLDAEEQYSEADGMVFISFPIADRSAPESQADASRLIEKLNSRLTVGENVVVHCRQGIGRSGLLAACLLITAGRSPDLAIAHLSAIRGAAIPETAEQSRWIDHYAATLIEK